MRIRPSFTETRQVPRALRSAPQKIRWTVKSGLFIVWGPTKGIAGVVCMCNRVRGRVKEHQCRSIKDCLSQPLALPSFSLPGQAPSEFWEFSRDQLCNGVLVGPPTLSEIVVQSVRGHKVNWN